MLPGGKRRNSGIESSITRRSASGKIREKKGGYNAGKGIKDNEQKSPRRCHTQKTRDAEAAKRVRDGRLKHLYREWLRSTRNKGKKRRDINSRTGTRRNKG